MKLSDLKIKTPTELLELAQSLGIENISRAKKQTLIFAILKYKTDNNKYFEKYLLTNTSDSNSNKIIIIIHKYIFVCICLIK